MLLRKLDKYQKLNDYDEICNQIMEQELPVVFFGASPNKLEIVKELMMQNMRIIAIIDNDPKYDGTFYEEIPIMLPEKCELNKLPVVVGVNQAPIELYRQLKNLGFSKLTPYLAFLEEDSKILDHLPLSLDFIIQGFECWRIEGVVLDSLDFVITEKCSLKCKECANLMQYFKNPKASDMDVLLSSFDILYKSIDYILELRILGGEPLMDKNLVEYIRRISQYKNIGSIMIFTNATIMFSEKLLIEMKDPRINVILSEYRNEKQKVKAISEQLRKSGIFFTVLEFDVWQPCATIKKHNRSDEMNIELMSNCCVAHTSVLKNGKLWRCPYSANLNALNVLSAQDNEHIELYENKISIELLRENIKEFLRFKQIGACDYCNGRPRFFTETIPPAEQVDEPIELEVDLLDKNV